MRLERRNKELLPRKKYLKRQFRYAAASMEVVALSLGVGVLGYPEIEGLA
jgi:hypothetical protein